MRAAALTPLGPYITVSGGEGKRRGDGCMLVAFAPAAYAQAEGVMRQEGW